MNDEQIVALYFARDETAIAASKSKYGRYCMTIAMQILRNEADSEECLNDTWFGAWRSIPPKRPVNLAAFLGKITRNLSINRYKMKYADKRAPGEFSLSIDELSECIPAARSVGYDEDDSVALGGIISAFLRRQKPLDRMVFVSRYFYGDALLDIAARFDISESRAKSLLFRMRAKLRQHLEEHGVSI